MEGFVAEAAGADRVRVAELQAIANGAIQDTRLLTLEIEGGPFAGRLAAVLRADARSKLPESNSRGEEFALLLVAHAAGVMVPEPLWLCTDERVIGRAFFIMRRVDGEAAGRLLIADTTLGGDRPALTRQLGAELAKIHAIAPPQDELGFLTSPDPTPALARVAQLRALLDRHGAPHPALEWGLRWLELKAPGAGEIVLTHGDYRTGNYLVDDRGLTGILDWEFSGWSDRHEDLGWFTAKCWRFGADRLVAGGIGEAETFFAGYEAASGTIVDRDKVAYWQIMAHIRWAIVALNQAQRHLTGDEPSLELALTAHIVPELELEVLRLTKEGA